MWSIKKPIEIKTFYIVFVMLPYPWQVLHKYFCIFGAQFYSKYARQLSFHVILHFYGGKHMIP